MAQVELVMPRMGESIMEATIIRWTKEVGDTVEAEETILEIATDKVDSEVPAPVSGTLSKVFFQADDVVAVGKVVALIATEGEENMPEASHTENLEGTKNIAAEAETEDIEEPLSPVEEKQEKPSPQRTAGNRFYSPLVRNIAKKEQIELSELDNLKGSGKNNRVTKKDILAYVKQRKSGSDATSTPSTPPLSIATSAISEQENVEIIEMDRMRRLIADHMVQSKRTSPHVTSFVEIDVTGIVQWRNKIKNDYLKKHGEKITFTPIFMQAVVKALQDFPMVNVSVDGYKIIRKKEINIGMATALPNNSLIVPVIKNADDLSLTGLSKKVNDLAQRARLGKLKPQDTQGGTFTLTNVGTFGNTTGIPIINQPQAAILATGSIKKKPAVLETEYGDVIAIRHLMFLSLSYDHRVIDGMLGGSFLRRVGDYLENFDTKQSI